MPESVAAVSAWYEGGTVAAGATAGGSAAGGAAAGGTTFGTALGQAAAGAAASAVVSKALAPDRPDLPKQVEMPDPLAQEAARQKMIAESIQRRGRASTIMTDTATGKLGG